VQDARRFYLALRPDKSRELTVLSGGWERCGEDYVVERARVPFTLIEFVASGAGGARLRGEEHELKPGTVLVYGRGISHSIRAAPGPPMTKYFAAFTGTAAAKLLRECKIAPAQVLRVGHLETIRQIFDDLIEHGLDDHPDRARMCGVALQYLIMKIADLAVPQDLAAGRAFATYQRCRAFIEKHCGELPSLQSAAERCHIDLTYLCRIFRRFGRESPYQYLQHLRMNRAADLLQNPPRPVKEVAALLGFPDPYNFSRAFKRVFGVSPARFTKRRAG
jgi:AraC-like DNA-binding protein